VTITTRDAARRAAAAERTDCAVCGGERHPDTWTANPQGHRYTTWTELRAAHDEQPDGEASLHAMRPEGHYHGPIDPEGR
jgi:hypothetical protein